MFIYRSFLILIFLSSLVGCAPASQNLNGIFNDGHALGAKLEAPADCQITTDPSSGTDTNVTLTLSCDSGSLPINIIWGTEKPSACPSQLTNSLTSECTAATNLQNTTWTISQFMNDAGLGLNSSNKSATFIYTPVPPPVVIPTGCKITATPASGTATSVTLGFSCTGGTLPIDIQWGTTRPAGCPTQLDTALSKVCMAPTNSQTTTWTISKFSNSAGFGNTNKSVTFNYVPVVVTPEAPAGCKISANPKTGAATSVTLTLSCASGSLPIDVTWGTTRPSGCPTQLDSLSKTCTAPTNSQNTTWTINQFSNSVGKGVDNGNKSATFTFIPASMEWANCPSGFLKATSFYPVILESSTTDIGMMYTGQTLSIRMSVPFKATQGKNLNGFFSSVYGGAPHSTWAISKTACDFDNPIIDVIHSNFDKGKIKYLKGQTSSNIDFSYTYGPTGTEGTTSSMEVGKTYYLNIHMDQCGNDSGDGCSYASIKLP